MVVGLKAHFKLPIAYFLSNGTSGSFTSTVISESLIRLAEIGMDVTTVTFDGHPSNVSAAKHLGANLLPD